MSTKTVCGRLLGRCNWERTRDEVNVEEELVMAAELQRDCLHNDTHEVYDKDGVL